MNDAHTETHNPIFEILQKANNQIVYINTIKTTSNSHTHTSSTAPRSYLHK
jgi:hypothetical protein